MLKRWIIGPLLGGLALFLWLGLSWAGLPFHMAQFRGFDDEEGFQKFLKGQVTEPGMYYLPSHPGAKADRAAWEKLDQLARQGPTITFASVQPAGYDPMSPTPFVLGTLYSILAALMATTILTRAAAALPTFGCRWRLCILIGCIIALTGPLTTGAFFMFSGGHLLLESLDHIIGWTILGLVLAWSTKPGTTLKGEAVSA